MAATEAVEKNGTSATGSGKSASKGQPRPRSLPSLQSVTGTSSMSEAAFLGRVDKNASEWSLLPLYAVFSTAEDGSHPMVKVSKSKCVSLVDGKAYPVGSGRCYRLVLSNK
jgi:hypothetical protein